MSAVRKLYLGFFALATVAGLLGIAGLLSTNWLASELFDSTHNTVRKVELLGEVATEIQTFRGALSACLFYAQTNRSAEYSSSRRQFDEALGKAESKIGTLASMLVTENRQRQLAKARGTLLEYGDAARAVLAALEAGKNEEAFRLRQEKVTPTGFRLLDDLRVFDSLMKDFMETASLRSERLSLAVDWSMGALLLIALAAGIAVVVLTRRLSGQMRLVSGELHEQAQRIGSASTQLASASAALAQGASSQASSIEEVSSAVEEISSSTAKNQEVAANSARLTAEAQVLGGMVQESVGKMADSVEAINSASGDISKILRVIDEIAFQTNILALNAAVEAARAGEAGMGFAVVADEVRSLAQRSAKAAQETSGLVERSVGLAREGKARLDEVMANWQKNADIRKHVKVGCDEVAASSSEQARGIQEVAKAILQVNQITQNAAAQAEESAASSGELSNEAQALFQLADQLKMLVGA